MFVTPIVLFIFNRPDLAKKQMEVLRKIQPQKLFIVSDAPRSGVLKEDELVDATRNVFENIPWECTVRKNYSERNLGCDKRITSGLDWVFEQVEEAIILEDDCIPRVDFFLFCEELLDRYKNNLKVYYISGTNPIKKYAFKKSYAFTYRGITWGWATWRRAWKSFNYGLFLESWNEEKVKKIEWPYLMPGDVKKWIGQLDRNRVNGIMPWDFCWFWHTMKNHGLSIVPNVNMIENVGFRSDATHTSAKNEKYDGTTSAMAFPLRHPESVKFDKRYYYENWKYEKPYYLKKLVDTNFYKRQWKKLFRSRC